MTCYTYILYSETLGRDFQSIHLLTTGLERKIEKRGAGRFLYARCLSGKKTLASINKPMKSYVGKILFAPSATTNCKITAKR